MQQVLFWIPIRNSWWPEGIPVYAYGTMLFLSFLGCILIASRLAQKRGINLSRDRIQDLAILVFIAGLAGARLTYMIQYHIPLRKFFFIWEGGIVLYGGLIGGTIAFLIFYRYVIRPLKINLWQMADVVAPTICIGVALGRVGCLLNGCCYGNPAPLGDPSMRFPLMTAPARDNLVEVNAWFKVTDERLAALQNAGNSDITEVDMAKLRTLKDKDVMSRDEFMNVLKPLSERLKNEDSRRRYEETVISYLSNPTDLQTLLGFREPKLAFDDTITVTQVEPGSEATKSGLLPGDKITKVKILDEWQSPAAFVKRLADWPRGRNEVQFVVQRDGQEKELPAFCPRTIGLHPTQLYETISMVLLLFLLLSFYPFRRHDGQVVVLLMIGYAFHRFMNEILRTEPVEGFEMTLSQLISVAVLVTAIGIEIYLRRQPALPRPQPPTPPAPTPATAPA
jgi:prolipoprotein diacylglyceryltransferase